jgi:hypothetical protein
VQRAGQEATAEAGIATSVAQGVAVVWTASLHELALVDVEAKAKRRAAGWVGGAAGPVQESAACLCHEAASDIQLTKALQSKKQRE